MSGKDADVYAFGPGARRVLNETEGKDPDQTIDDKKERQDFTLDPQGAFRRDGRPSILDEAVDGTNLGGDGPSEPGKGPEVGGQ